MSTDFSTSRWVLAIFSWRPLGAGGGLQLQGGQPDVDAGQGLRDFIVQLAADHLALLFLRGQELARKVPQLLLHVARLLEEAAVMPLALAQGLLGGQAPDDLPLQLAVRCRQVPAAPAQRVNHVAQVVVRFPGRAVRLRDRSHGPGKEGARPPHQRLRGRRHLPGGGRQQGPFVQAGQVQCLQPEGHGLAAQAARGPQACLCAPVQVVVQRGPVRQGEAGPLTLHVVRHWHGRTSS
jgi:hypothetical protein